MRWTALLILLGIAPIIGCEREQQTAAPAPPPTATSTTTPSTVSASQSAAIVAKPAVITIDYQHFDFPPARMRLRVEDDKIVALLHSDDPPEAIEDTYTGNSFYLEMPLEISDRSEIASAEWKFKAPTSDRAESANGIFIEGMRQQLQPFDVQVAFEAQDPATGMMTVYLSGHFLLFDSKEPAAPGRLVLVGARFNAKVESSPQ